MGQPEIAADPNKFQELAKEASKLQSVVDVFNSFQAKTEALVDTRALLKESETEDEDLAEMAREEIVELEAALQVSRVVP